MLSSKRLWALSLALLTIAQLNSGFKMGSRGLSEIDMASQSQSELEAGNNNKNNHKNTNRNIKKPSDSSFLKAFTNKEYVFGDDDDDNEDTNESYELLPNEIAGKTVEASNHLKRQQRTNAQTMDLADLEKIVLSMYKTNDDYDMLFDAINSEDIMNAKEIKGFNGEMNDDEGPEDYLNNADLESLIMNQISAGGNSYDERPKAVQKPLIHYKELYLSGDVYNKKLDGINKKPNFRFKSISEAPTVPNYPGQLKNEKFIHENDPNEKLNIMKSQRDYLFVSVIAGCTIAALLAFIVGGVCVYTVKRNKQTGFDSKLGLFGSSGVTKSNSIKSTSSSSSGDRRLAQSAQMFHYQHQKQQMIAMEKANNDTKQDQSDNSDGETEEGDYTVYECPGLAPTGEMEVKNPLFKEDYPSSNSLAASNSLSAMPPSYTSVTTSKSSSESDTTTKKPDVETTPNQLPINNKNTNESATTNITTLSEEEEKQ